ncbi:MAG: hypothetical protein ABFS34_11165 [Gemmatimonadota bacterium]
MSRLGAPLWLRGLGLACLLALLFLGAAPFGSGDASGPGDDGGPGALADGAARWRAALSGDAPPGLTVRADTSDVGVAELAALAAVAARAPLAVALPDPGAPTLSLEAVGPLAAGRRGALSVTVSGPAHADVAVVLADDAGGADSVSVRTDRDGVGRASVGVRPASSGWRAWRAAAGDRSATAGAWVEDASAPRVVVLGEAAGWEPRYAIRALEEAGFDVRARLALGRGRSVEDDAAGGLDSADVVVILPGAALSTGDADEVAALVLERGGGALLAGPPPARLAERLGLPVGARFAESGADIAWTLPADLAPLPAGVPERRPLTAEPPVGARVGASAGADATLLLRAAGAGRAAWTGLTRTWRWRLQEGATEAHAAYWAALADWLAAGRLAGARYGFEPAAPALGELVRIRAPVGARVSLRRPDGSTEPVGVRAFVAAAEGVHALVDSDGAALVGARVSAPAARPGGAGADPSSGAGDGPGGAPFGLARAALLAHASGGTALPPAALRRWLEGRPTPARGGAPLAAWILLGAAAASLGGAWVAGRIRGLPAGSLAGRDTGAEVVALASKPARPPVR